jgi:hypothetical protein
MALLSLAHHQVAGIARARISAVRKRFQSFQSRRLAAVPSVLFVTAGLSAMAQLLSRPLVAGQMPGKQIREQSHLREETASG